MAAPPSTMKAWIFKTQGNPSEVLKYQDVQVPKPSKGQVLVNTKAVGLNPIGYKAINMLPSLMVKTPGIPESDFSGVVTSVADGVSAFKAGDEVYGIYPAENVLKTGTGALAEYVIADAEHVVIKNPKLSWEEAAGIPLAAITAYQALVEEAGLQAGHRVFINGSSGGVGMFAVQIAKALGAYVVGSCSDRSMDFVKRLGPDEIVDYKAVGNLPAHLIKTYANAPFDIIFDTVGVNEIFTNCEYYLKRQGRFVNVGADGSMLKFGADVVKNKFLPRFLGGVDRQYTFVSMKATSNKLQAINNLVNEGKVKCYVDSVHPFATATTAYEKIMSHRAQGKVVVQVSQ